MGRGSSKAGGSAGGGRFNSVSDFEKSLSGLDDPKLKEYSNAYDSERSYTSGLEKNLNRAINEDGYKAVADTIASEEKYTKNQLNNLPSQKTPSQLGEAEALNERLDMLSDLKKKKNVKGKGKGDVDIIKY